MAYSYLTPKNIYQRYQAAKDYTDKLTQPFPEFARLARNKPIEVENFPKVTDGTTAGIIRKTPKNAVQQLPTGLVECEYNNTDWLTIVAQFIYDTEIIPYANEEYGLFEKCHLLIEGGLTFGSQATFRRFARHRNGFSPDVELCYWGDITIQKGKKSGPACDYVFYRTWWQESDLKALIDDEKQRIKDAKKNGEKYQGTWDIEAIDKVLNFVSQKDRQALTPSEEDRGVQNDGIELITGFQKGVGNKFYTFHLDSQTIVRTKTNTDPRGMLPIDWFYGDIDGTNPLGRSIPELVGSLQNLIDSRMQKQEYVATYGINPAVIEYGEADSSFEYSPNKIIRTNDPNYKVVPVDIDTSSLKDFIQTQQYLQSQLYQLVTTPHSNTPSSSAVVTDGKTPAAINQQQATLDIDINAIRKRFESWWESFSEGAINQWFAEHHGVEIIQLDKETATKLRQIPATEAFDPTQMVNDQDQLILNYDTATPALKFRVDASSSKMQDDAAQLKALQLVEQFISGSQIMQKLIMLIPDKAVSIYNSVVQLAGLENPEKLVFTDEEKQQIQQALQAQAMRPPSEVINYKDVAAADPQASAEMLQQAGLQPGQLPQQSGQLGPVTQQHIDELRALGIPDEQIQQAIAIYNQRNGITNG